MTLRGALIGCGFFAANHMRAWAAVQGAEIVAVCDRDPSRAEAFAKEFGARAYSDAAAMLAEVQPDFTDIATTVASHRMLVELAARHSGGVICQKPFAETLADAEAMVAACNAAGIPLLVHENFRWQAPYRELMEQVRAGAIGVPRFMRLSFRHSFDIYAGQPYLVEVEDLALMDVGLHLFDMVRAVMGDASRVYCQTQRLNPKIKGQDSFLAQLTHNSGAISSIECSFFSHYEPDRFVQTLAVIEGDLGSIEITEGYQLYLHRDGYRTQVDVTPPSRWSGRPWNLVQDSVLAFQEHAIEVFADGTEGQPSGTDNLKTLALTLAAIQSAKEGQSIDLSKAKPAAGVKNGVLVGG